MPDDFASHIGGGIMHVNLIDDTFPSYTKSQSYAK